MSATQNFTTTVTASFNQMTMPIASGQLYHLKGAINFTLDSGSQGITIGLQFPAARRAKFNGWVPAQVVNPDPPTLTGITMNGTTSGVGTNFGVWTSGTALGRVMMFDGELLCSGSGNLIFFGLSESANTTGKILEGSHVIAWNIGPLPV